MQFMLAINNILKGIKSILTKKKENLSGYGRLHGYGDLYEVRDLRKRGRKEPYELAANKNLVFKKINNWQNTYENFDHTLFNNEKYESVKVELINSKYFIKFNFFIAKIKDQNSPKKYRGNEYLIEKEVEKKDLHNIKNLNYVGGNFYSASILKSLYNSLKKEAFNDFLKLLDEWVQNAKDNIIKEQNSSFGNKEYWVKRAEERLKEAEKERKYTLDYYNNNKDSELQDFDSQTLGKPIIKFEFENNEELKNFLKENKENLIESYIDVDEYQDNSKALNGYGDYSDDLGKAGDLYIVRDLRTRAKKEPGETIANKNLNFVKIKDAKIENFNKELYENKTVFDFDRDFNEYKSVRIENKDNRNIIEFVFFLPTKRLKNQNDNALGGSFITVGIDIDIKKVINIQINPYSNSNKPSLQRIEADARKTKEYNYYYIDNNSTKDYYGWITDKYYNQLRQNAFNKFYSDYINREERFYTNYQKKLLKSFYSNPQNFEIYQVSRFDNDFSKIDNKTRESYVGLLQNSALNGYGLDIYNCPLSMLDCKSMHPTYPHFDDYSKFIEKADNESKLFGYGFEKATLNTLRDTVLDNYQQVKELAKTLKGETDLQTFFNIWYFLHEQIKYGLDAAGKEEIRTPARCWADRFNGVDCDCLAVFTAALLINLGYKPKFEIVAMNNNPNFEHIYVVVDGIVIDRVLPAFNERPKNITKTLTMDIPVYQLSGIAGCKKSNLNGVTDDILSVTNYDSSVVALNNNEDDFSKVVINLNTTAETENPLSNSDSANNEYIYSAVPEVDTTKKSNKTAIGFFAIFSVLSIYALLKK